MAKPAEPVIQATELRKYFGGVQALRSATFTLWPGEVLAVVGGNGAGKSTLLKILAGAQPPDGGELRVRGELVGSHDVATSRQLGIEMVYQDLGLVPNMDPAYNLFLGRIPRKWGVFIDRKKMLERTREVLAELHISTVQDLRGPVDGMSGGQRQALAIGRAVTWGSGVVILDEPAAALGIAETEQVLKLIVDLKRRGAAILLVSHNLDHVFQVADRVLVMHQGRSVAEVPTKDISPSQLASVITTGGL
jgi:ABC-type sugar transport system ATPase subunit